LGWGEGRVGVRRGGAWARGVGRKSERAAEA
jgi:hypothetical protein